MKFLSPYLVTIASELSLLLGILISIIALSN